MKYTDYKIDTRAHKHYDQRYRGEQNTPLKYPGMETPSTTLNKGIWRFGVSARRKLDVFDILLLWSANSDSIPECRSNAPLHCKHTDPDMGTNKCLHLCRQASWCFKTERILRLETGKLRRGKAQWPPERHKANWGTNARSEGFYLNAKSTSANILSDARFCSNPLIVAVGAQGQILTWLRAR